MTNKLAFRPAYEPDIAYIKHTILKTNRQGEGSSGQPNSVYYTYEPAVLSWTLPRCSKVGGIIVAYEALPEGATTKQKVEAPILGFIVSEPLKTGLCVHFVYARKRRQGIGSALLKQAHEKFKTEGQPVTFTYRPPICWKDPFFLELLRPPHYIFNPYLKMTIPGGGWEVGAK